MSVQGSAWQRDEGVGDGGAGEAPNRGQERFGEWLRSRSHEKAGLELKRPLEKQEFPREAGGGGGTPGRTSVGKGAA